MTRTASNRHVLIAEGPESLVVSESEKVVVIEVSFYRLGGVLFIFTIILSISHACHGNKRILIFLSGGAFWWRESVSNGLESGPPAGAISDERQLNPIRILSPVRGLIPRS